MKRLLAPVLLAVLCVGGLSACGDGDDAVVTVNGEVVLTRSDWEAEIEEFADSDDFLDAFDARGTGGDGTLDAEALTSVLNNHVLVPVLGDLVEREGIEVTDQDRETGAEILTSVLANPSPESGNAPIALEDLPDRYRALLTDLYVNFTAAIRYYGASPEEENDPNVQAAQEQFNAALTELREEADIEIDPAYGTWNPDGPTPGVEPPEGPVTPTTVTPTLPVPAGG